MKLKHFVVLVAVVGLVVPVPALMAASHTINGCDGCHSVHNAPGTAIDMDLPLWSGIETSSTFTLYSSGSSTTYDAIGETQPDGNSKMCLSCHDGTATFTDANDNLGTDLTKHHPISFTYATAHPDVTSGDLVDPSSASSSGLGGTIAEDMLSSDKVQCTSCHDIHEHTFTDKALIKDNTNGDLCKTCHIK